ncbi:DUF2599 domain-containing protein [Pseudomonas aegrilactucae]|uniref:DUF2599 domain-containing protein n=1 Tax=Pseudomonas aegrilactucae TaxID=2854028 RepID=A0A9Q2XF10_9PSED|nr:DUF2599 domain-containing protein [Pseudomonas aegrilactucae]MBV6286102.1 DUF2599 domain-containing protein [Pseudomonas aegrilactucae]
MKKITTGFLSVTAWILSCTALSGVNAQEGIYIDSATWALRDSPRAKQPTWTLSIVPTAKGRSMGEQEFAQAFEELSRNHSQDWQWRVYDRGVMQQQFECHARYTKEKYDWNIEPFRPSVPDQAQLWAEGCNPIDQQSIDRLNQIAAGDESGSTLLVGMRLAENLTKRYYDTRDNCGTSNRPAFLCSGIIMRVVDRAKVNPVWNTSRTSQKEGHKGVSFSYMRTDTKFAALAWHNNSGIIFFPKLSAPAGKSNPEVLCAFPVDAYGWHRTDGPCDKPENSCRGKGITTGAQWLAHFRSPGAQHEKCGFDVSKNAKDNNPAADFMAIRDAMKLLGNDLFDQWNELVLYPWQQNTPETVPLEAFFYSGQGVEEARKNQTDFYNQAGRVIPIVRITLPASFDRRDPPGKVDKSEARFDFFAVDQAIIRGTAAPSARCANYFDSANWITRGTMVSLSVVPSACGRYVGDADLDNAIAELMHKHGLDSQWTTNDGGGMRAQLECVSRYARDFAQWNLEAFRPKLSSEETRLASCNPS